MAITGSDALTITTTGGPSGNRSLNWSGTISAGVDVITVMTLSSGNNTVNVPAGATRCVICPPNMASPVPNPPNAATLKLGSTDQIPISSTIPTRLGWDTAPSTFVIVASGSALVEFFFA